MTTSTGIWLIILTSLVIIYSVYFFGDSSPKHRTMRDRLRLIQLPSMEFMSLSLSEAVQALTNLAEVNDDAGDGVQFSAETVNESAAIAEPILIRFERSSLWDAIEHIALLYHVVYHIDASSCSITFTEQPERPPLLQRHYLLPVDRFPMSWACTDFLAYFKGHGLPFPESNGIASHIEYDSKTRIISVTTSENTLNLMEKMFGLDPERTPEISDVPTTTG